jgi:hypothetical protein
MAQTGHHITPKFLKFNCHLIVALLCIVFIMSGFNGELKAQVTSQGPGAWNLGTTWVGGVVPAAGQNVVINHDVTINFTTPIVVNVTVNASGILTILNSAASTLQYSGAMVVAGSLINNGGIVQTTTGGGRLFQLTGIGAYTHNPSNVTALDESIFSRSNEVFSATSTLTIQKWFDVNLPLGGATRVQQPITFGNVTMNIPDLTIWEQDDEFMMSTGDPRVLGTLKVSSGTVRMDEGAGGSTYMKFQDIMVNGTGNIIFISGPSRPFVLITNSFTDVSTSANATVIMDNCFNNTFWTVNGSVYLAHNFFGIVGTGTNSGGILTINITGSLDIAGGSVQFVSNAWAPLTLTVNANTTISGNPTKVRFVDGNPGNLTFSTNNFTVSGGADNVLMGGNGLIPVASGVPSITINNDFIISGAGATNLTLLDASYSGTGFSSQRLALKVNHDFTINNPNANFLAARSRGALLVHVVNNFTLSAGRFIGQIDTLNAATDSLLIGGNFLMNATGALDYLRINYGSGNTSFRCNNNYTQATTSLTAGFGFIGIFSGAGLMDFYVGATMAVNSGRFAAIYNSKANVITKSLTFYVGLNCNIGGGIFRGIENRVADNAGTVNFTVGNMNFTGGNFSCYYASHNATGTMNFTTIGQLQITFPGALTDTFSLIGLYSVGASVSNLKLNVNVGGNFNITGPNGSFISSIADGRETITVTGSVNFSGGYNSFNSYPSATLSNAHVVVFNVGANFSVFGGSTYLSADNDSLIASVAGNFSISVGELVVHGGESAPGTFSIAGGFTQTGGSLYLHKNLAGSSNQTVEMIVNSDNNATGDFSQTAGTIYFSNNPVTPGSKLLTINSPIITYGGTGAMTLANPGTNDYFGTVRYGRTGTSTFNRSSLTHSIQQVLQQVLSGTTLLVSTGNVQISSYDVPVTSMFTINNGGVLDLQGNQIFSNNLQAYSGVTISGRLRLTKPQGLYDGTVNAAINSLGGMNYRIFTNSTVEYYGSDNQVVTGIGVGLATSSFQKYSNLEINFTGTPDVEFAYPTNLPNTRSVFVRSKLILTNGELNLDSDHSPLTGGRSIILENDSLTSIVATGGYIRSEVYDSTASVIWKVNSRTGPRIIPFGYNNANRIPFTFDLGSGNADTLFVSTYHTPLADNLPYPPPVIHVNNLTGTDNSAYTVDRFWYIRSTGTSTNANLTFKATPAEVGSIANLRAQPYIPNAIIPNAWQYPLQGVQSSIANGTYVGSANYYPANWWTLAGLANPLPVSLLDFSSDCNNNHTELKWSTGSEINNSHFTVLKSTDGVSYEPIGTVQGNGTVSSNSYYKFVDQQINVRLSYFKLVQTDYDGKETIYGPIVASSCGKLNALEVSVIPSNPDELTVLIKNPKADKFRISLINLEGKLILSKVVEFENGLNLVSLPTSGLSSGIYFVNVRSATENISTKVPVGFSR